MALEKIQTGLSELDNILGGGISKDFVTFITGGPGSGKTILSIQFLLNGATKYSDKGLIITFNGSYSALKQYMFPLG
ncbi:MAG: ATPase domain-containing protein [Nitrososphaeria archaeon]